MQHAVGVARADWRRKLLAESKTSVEEALAQAQQVWNERSTFYFIHCCCEVV